MMAVELVSWLALGDCSQQTLVSIWMSVATPQCLHPSVFSCTSVSEQDFFSTNNLVAAAFA